MHDKLFDEGAALIIGGSGGIGSAICREFARAGADVALTYNARVDNAQRVASEIEALQRKASVHRLALQDPDSVEAVIAEATAIFGKIHTVVFGAAPLADQVYISQIQPAQWKAVFEQEVTGFYNVVQAILPRFRAWGGGALVHIGSAGDLKWANRDGLSIVPKAANEAMIRGIAKEEGRFGIRANTVLVGVIEAGMFLELRRQGVFDAHYIQETYKQLGLKRLGRPEEIGHAAVFLASNKAAYVTGQQIAVAGGFGL